MSDGGIMVLDGNTLRSLHVSLPEDRVTLTGAQVLDFAESEASQSLFGISLPPHLKSSALRRINIDGVDDDTSFRRTELSRDEASRKLSDYLSAIADVLKDNPLAVSILDGNTLRMFLEDEDDFAMIAENLFTDLDTEDKGKISKSEIRNAVVHMGVEMGVPPLEEFPLLNDILKKHEEEEGELGQSQFAELLQPILQELADALAKKHVAFIHKIKIVNGSEIRKVIMSAVRKLITKAHGYGNRNLRASGHKHSMEITGWLVDFTFVKIAIISHKPLQVLADEKKLNDVIAKALHGKHKNDQKSTEIIRDFLEKNGKELGLPPSEANEAVILLYDAVFTDINSGKDVSLDEDESRKLVREILENFAEQLEANPVYCDLDG
ncbi:hypothetical protein DKX38_007269 [Salix brachista]|uniref:EF-hand domain-containing protein n=1 Tax=Salix brachista TaxID=2182728 RepID=A0A5N5MMG0_9ROSI|nr:hypothetical protein DKX38_007269 [Salix brachista]